MPWSLNEKGHRPRPYVLQLIVEFYGTMFGLQLCIIFVLAILIVIKFLMFRVNLISKKLLFLIKRKRFEDSWWRK